MDDPIKLEIHATNAPDLTLIDLPGITLVPMKGSDQNEDIEKITKDMTMRYLLLQHALVLSCSSYVHLFTVLPPFYYLRHHSLRSGMPIVLMFSPSHLHQLAT